MTGTSALSGQVTNAAGTITTSQPFTITQTWNAGGVTFNPFLISVTSTASAAASLLMDMQLGGTSVFNINKSGGVFVPISNTSGYNFGPNGVQAVYSPTGSLRLVLVANSNDVAEANASGFSIRAGSVFAFTSSTLPSSNDTTLSRQAALRNSAPQQLMPPVHGSQPRAPSRAARSRIKPMCWRLRRRNRRVLRRNRMQF